MTRSALLSLLIVLLLAGESTAANTFTVKYLSAEHVYLDGGEADGLLIGTRLVLQRKADVELEVVFVAAHSASCTIVTGAGGIVVGDRFLVKEQPTVGTSLVQDTLENSQPLEQSVPALAPVVSKKLPPTPLTGNVSFGFFNWNDHQPENLDFSQTTARMTLQARHLWGKEITFSARGRGRFDQRQRAYSSQIDRQNWQNRLWEFSLSYEEPHAPINLYLGRILPRHAGAVSYVDGALAEVLLSNKFRIAAFGGTSPEWMYDSRSFTLMKAGGYATYTAGSYASTFIEQTFGAVGEYHSGEVNREYVILQGRFSQGSVWGIAHTAEIEINRGWRKVKAGKSLTLSNLYASLWVRPTDRVRLGLSYDNRTNYWTYEIKTVVDSLFDDHARQGMRLQTDITLPAQMYFSGSFGFRKRSGDSVPTYAFSTMIRRSNMIMRNLSLSAQYAGFNAPVDHGHNYSIRASQPIGRRVTLGAAYGAYSYRIESTSVDRNNTWIELSWQIDLGRRYWANTTFLNNSGDDIHGLSIQTELGLRF